LGQLNQIVTQVNQLIDKEKVWDLVKSDAKRAAKVLNEAASQIIIIAEELKPFLPSTSDKIIKQFTADKIIKGEALFPRIS
jgi:methionyl-tRNA synthetase